MIAYGVTQRTQEIGIRMALGAQRGDVLRMVVRQALVLVAVGIAIGGAGALLLTRLMAGLLFQVGASDPTHVRRRQRHPGGCRAGGELSSRPPRDARRSGRSTAILKQRARQHSPAGPFLTSNFNTLASAFKRQHAQHYFVAAARSVTALESSFTLA